METRAQQLQIKAVTDELIRRLADLSKMPDGTDTHIATTQALIDFIREANAVTHPGEKPPTRAFEWLLEQLQQKSLRPRA